MVKTDLFDVLFSHEIFAAGQSFFGGHINDVYIYLYMQKNVKIL